jgi:hypothetical protein
LAAEGGIFGSYSYLPSQRVWSIKRVWSAIGELPRAVVAAFWSFALCIPSNLAC